VQDVEEIANIGLDWLTVTTVEGSHTDSLIATSRDIVSRMLPENVIPKDWRAMGYVGQNYGQLKFGRRKADESILILSGSLAEEVGVTYHVPPERVTRADFQVTVAPEVPDPNVAHRLHTKHQSLTTATTGSILWTYISSATGDTFSMGKRGRNKYLRLYDKSKDYSPDSPGSYWRYELELKGATAKKGMELLYAADDRYDFIAAQVFNAFEQRGVRPAFSVDTDIVAMEVAQKVTTADTKIAWLSRCVAPVVTQLVNLGYEEQVLKSLRLRGVYRDGDE